MTGSLLTHNMKILLADDDIDDCLLFKEALGELQLNTSLTLIHDGEQLIKLLTLNSDNMFDVLFLDLNMPRKNGYACLEEIRNNEKLKLLTVIIFSTSFDPRATELLYKKGANHYICKPNDFSDLRKIIYTTLILVSEKNALPTARENFYIEV